ncbi:MAG: hypothetical protein Kow00109_06960 [Acidobacteriota bacterium]
MERRRVDKGGAAGFTLIEAMAALLILTISLLALAQLMLLALHQHEFAKNDAKALNLAQAKLEELRNLYGWEIDSGQAAEALSPGLHGPETVILSVPEGTLQGTLGFQVSWQVTELESGRKEVQVSVSPLNNHPWQTDTVTLSTRFAP